MDFGYFTLTDNNYLNNRRSRMNAFAISLPRPSMRKSRLPLRLGRRASFQFARREVRPDLALGLRRREDEADPPRAGGQRVAIAPSDPRRRAMGDARSPQRRPRRFRQRPRLRPQRIRAVRRRSMTTPRPSPKVSKSCSGSGRAIGRSRITASTIPSTMCGSRRSRCSGRCRSMSRRSRSPRSSSRQARLRASSSRPAPQPRCIGGLKQVARDLSRSLRRAGPSRERLDVSYFIHFADTPEERRPRASGNCATTRNAASPAFPGDPKTRARGLSLYFIKIVECYKTMKPEDFTENAVLVGNAAKIIDTLKEGRSRRLRRGDPLFQSRSQAAAQVKDEMGRFMEEVAPKFR